MPPEWKRGRPSLLYRWVQGLAAPFDSVSCRVLQQGTRLFVGVMAEELKVGLFPRSWFDGEEVIPDSQGGMRFHELSGQDSGRR